MIRRHLIRWLIVRGQTLLILFTTKQRGTSGIWASVDARKRPITRLRLSDFGREREQRIQFGARAWSPTQLSAFIRLAAAADADINNYKNQRNNSAEGHHMKS
jgi:hypothetical protein